MNNLREYNPNAAHIVYASDNNFAEILGVSLVSLLENNREMDTISIYILDSGISQDNRRRIETVCKNYGRNAPTWILAKDISEELAMDVAVDRGSLSQYARLFVSSLLPEALSKILYFDCDIIVNQSIRELWNLELKGKTIAALLDAFSGHYRKNIDLKPNDGMFNSGVMLIDLDKWREQNIEDKLIQFIARKNGHIQQGDQGALNAILSHDTYFFEPKFNSLTIYYDFTYQEILVYRKPPKFYTENQVRETVDNPVIIHFTTSFLSKRPWVRGCEHKYVEKWLKYKSLSPWKDELLREDSRPKWKLTGIKIYKMLPSWFAIRIAGFAQAYVRPLLFSLRAWL